MRKVLAVVCMLLTLGFGLSSPGLAQQQSALSYVAAVRVATNYSWHGLVLAGNSATGAQTVTIGLNNALPDGRQFLPFGTGTGVLVPVTFDMGANNETITPTAVSYITCPLTGQFGPQIQCVSFTGTFSFTHGTNAVVGSGSAGLQEAIIDANSVGGGTVVIDNAWGGTAAMIAAAIPFPSVVIRDERGARTQFYGVQPSNATTIATPATLVAAATCTASTTVCSGTAATLGGVSATWASATNHFCVTYVDLHGHEGPCSADASFTTTASVVVLVTAPPASAGAVGYLVYAGATYAAATRLPVVAGTTGGPTCVLTAVETVTPACAVANTIYGQSASNATFALTEATTQPQPPGATITTFTTLQAFDLPKTAYAYQQTNIPAPNFTTGYPAFAASTGTSASNWELGRALIPSGYLNTIGKSIRVSGLITTTGNTVPTTTITVAMGPPWVASVGAAVCTMVNTTAQSAVVWNISFSCTITTQTISVAAGTGGTVLGNGWFMQSFTTGTTAGNLAVNKVVAPVTVNLFGATEIEIILLPTSSTGMTAPQLIQLSVEPIN